MDDRRNDSSQFRVRPIINSVGGTEDRISWLPNLVLVQLRLVLVHLLDTWAFWKTLGKWKVAV